MILVTGGLGLIGLHTARCLLDMGEDVVLTQYRVRREPDFLVSELGRRAFAEQLDVQDQERLLAIGRAYPITGVAHLAAPGLGALGPKEEFDTNVRGLLNVLEAARVWGVRRLLLASSIAVYAGLARGPFREDQPLRMSGGNPTETYKKTFEILGQHYGQRAGIDVVVARIGGVYGPLDHNLFNPVTRFLHIALKGTPSPWPGELFEEDANDHCHVRDVARGIALLQTAGHLSHRVYNVSSGRATSNGEIAAVVRRYAPEAKLPLAPGRGPSYRPEPAMDISRIAADTGYEPQFNLESAVADYVEWLSTHPE